MKMRKISRGQTNPDHPCHRLVPSECFFFFVSIVVCFSVNCQRSESPQMQVVFVIQNKDEKKKGNNFCLSMRSKYRYLPAGFQSSEMDLARDVLILFLT